MYKILHIETCSFSHKIVKEVVTQKGFEYIACDSYTEALITLNKIPIDLILTSTNIPGMKINDFIKEVKYRNESLPVCIVTSNNNSEALFNLGVHNYIGKNKLIPELESYLDDIFVSPLKGNILNDREVAIIDDNVLSRLEVKNILQKYHSKNIYSFNNGCELFKANKPFDIYLVDIVLKNESGLNLIKKIKSLNKDSIIIAITALYNQDVLSEALDFGADDIINKPINERLLISKINARLRE